jgi:hypothetical protein
LSAALAFPSCRLRSMIHKASLHDTFLGEEAPCELES